jgi:flagellar motor switch/type III secretory pathway protein FliN
MLEIKETNRNLDEKKTQSLGDPFAVDFFGASVSQIEELSFLNEDFVEEIAVENEPEIVQLPKKLWADDLPKIAKDEVRFSNSIQFLPAKLSLFGKNKIEASLSHFIFGEPDKVFIQTVDNKEVKLSEALALANIEQSVFISIAAEPGNNFAVLVLDSILASQIVDKTLGGLGLTKLVRRKLSRTEETVVEFLSVCLLSDLNEKLGEPLFRVSSIEQQIPAWLEFHKNKSDLRGMTASVQLDFDDIKGIAKFVYSNDFLTELSRHENLLLKYKDKTEIFNKYKQITFELKSQILVGTTNFTVKELAGLEKGDFIVLEETFAEWDDLILSANSYVEFADNFKVYGEIEPDSNGKLFVNIQDILTDLRQENALERIKMEPEFNEDAENEDVSVVLDNIMLNVNVVLPGRKISLEELSRLRNGQILELGCKATDQVELQTDGKKIATGDLIDIEGNLGVRLSKVFV